MLQVYTETLEAWKSSIETLVSNRLNLVFTLSEEGWVHRADEISRLGVSLHWLHSNLEFDSEKQD